MISGAAAHAVLLALLLAAAAAAAEDNVLELRILGFTVRPPSSLEAAYEAGLRFGDDHLAGTRLPANLKFAVSAFVPEHPGDQANLHSSLALKLDAPVITSLRYMEYALC